jgi:hypothetical protein
MTTRYINASIIGTGSNGGRYRIEASHAGAAAGNLTITYDDTKFNQRSFRDALDAAMKVLAGSNYLLV